MMKKQIINNLLILIILLQFNTSAFGEEKIKINIVSDVVCPWCAIGYKRLSTAINELEIQDKVEIEWHPFQLNPDMPKEGQNANKYLMNKLSLNEEQLIKKRSDVTKLGEDVDFKFNYFKDMKKVNTFNAHILLDYAKEFNKQTQLKVRLQEAYFGEKKNINNREVLASELKRVGLNVNEAMAKLDDEKVIKRVKEEEKYFRDNGVFAIPTMIFNNKIIRVGANKVEDYKELLISLVKEK
jgi:predicted DsbA family dithiol-disulfide isomerase